MADFHATDTGLLTDIGWLATCPPGGGQDGIGVIHQAALAWRDGRIEWVGRQSDLPPALRERETRSAEGRMVVPGLVDCHTHLVFGGWRADEFRRRLAGESYLDIAASGGGIQRTMRQTREADTEVLALHALGCLRAMARLGITTVECKTGYGLSFEDELRLLRVVRDIRPRTPQRIVSTLLAAHVVPPECNKDSYIQMITEDLIPAVAEAQLADFNDIFVEEGAFSADDARRILGAGRRYGLRPKLHVDQLHDGNGAALAAELGAISADHLEFTSDAGRQAMARAEVIGVCLPLASLYLHQPPMDGRAFVRAGVPVAVATDFNPGSAPSYDLPLAMMLACTISRLTPAEALKGATIHAAAAIGVATETGSLEPGKAADFAEYSADNVDDWMYHFRPNVCERTWIGGQVVHGTHLS
ncbi:MAG: imidazolonepropionase [Bacteroidetes bacterium]|nr:imidazolonepropionase [Bacteroidota bacterium]MDA0873993.1 imidazolonepropionase [Bacteroidota bacterium]